MLNQKCSCNNSRIRSRCRTWRNNKCRGRCLATLSKQVYSNPSKVSRSCSNPCKVNSSCSHLCKVSSSCSHPCKVSIPCNNLCKVNSSCNFRETLNIPQVINMGKMVHRCLQLLRDMTLLDRLSDRINYQVSIIPMLFQDKK